jgi:hypothetical protein
MLGNSPNRWERVGLGNIIPKGLKKLTAVPSLFVFTLQNVSLCKHSALIILIWGNFLAVVDSSPQKVPMSQWHVSSLLSLSRPHTHTHTHTHTRMPTDYILRMICGNLEFIKIGSGFQKFMEVIFTDMGKVSSNTDRHVQHRGQGDETFSHMG